ncbi:asparagine synthase (glutamine-hydrolyzing) [Candidatus Woesearchaeota archaeon]|nr:asparagine synthase (glutamine-hydrolyzing) [Candidatus Woesearchaeota archaeon]
MCGITGFYNFEDKVLLRRMMSAIQHRGPDDHGTYVDDHCSLGHLRLSIIDVSGGKQPLSNEDGSVWIAFNGEIFNYQDLRIMLERKGHEFTTNSDTETIVHAYEEFGEKCAELLNGFFAFAIYDQNKKQLFLARDRLGVKPLYYAVQDDAFFFASEIKALLENKELPRAVNLDALHDYLSFRANTTAHTMFKGLKKLPPAHTMLVSKDGVRVKRYWSLKYAQSDVSEQETALHIQQLFHDSVQRRLMSEVPLGLWLSGGIDSSSVLAMMAQSTSEPVKTFSVGFGTKDWDELKYARLSAQHFNTDHEEVIINPDYAKLLPKLVWHLDEPMSDPTVIPTYLLSQHTKKKVTVVLTGEGGDETFGGYENYKLMLQHQRIRHFPRAIRSLGAGVATKLPAAVLNRFFKYAGSLGEEGLLRMKRFAATNDEAEAYLAITSIFSEEEKQALYAETTKQTLAGTNTMNTWRERFFADKQPLLNKLTNAEINTLLVDDLLMKVDKMSMAFGVEARTPFLDYRLVEYSAQIPSRFKIQHGVEKAILRKAMQPYIPKAIAERKKARFFVPIHEWFKGDLMDMAKDELAPAILRRQGFFEPTTVQRMFDRFDTSPLYYSRQLWSLLCFQLWMKEFEVVDSAQ